MRVSIVGAGYVGLVTAAALAEIGHDVVCADRDRHKVDLIDSGVSPIYEPGLQELLTKHARKRLTAIQDVRKAVIDTDLSLVCVDTPFDGSRINLDSVKAVSREIGTALSEKSDYHTVVVKSTVVPGTTDAVVLPLLEKESGRTAGEDFGVGVNPEFLREAQAVADALNPDRLVLGANDQGTREAFAELYAPFPDTHRIWTAIRTAELIKYASNALFATLISFSNEIANLAADIGVDAMQVMNGVHFDRRLTPITDDGSRVWPGLIAYLKPGCGFGGSCFPKDVRSLVAFASEVETPMRLLPSVMEVNDAQPSRMLKLLGRHLADLKGARVTVLGLAFKPDTSDIRESPSLDVIKGLLDGGAEVTVFDPVAHEEARKVLGDGVAYADDLSSAVDTADGVLLMTAWPEFEILPSLLSETHSPVVVDGRRLFSKESFTRYEAIGL